MRTKVMIILFLSSIGCSSAGIAQEIMTPTKLANGAKCSSGQPNDVPTASNLCQSGRCMPGPGTGGSNSDWYCISPAKNCAQPGGDGGMHGQTMSVAGATYVCRIGDGKDVEGPSRYAP